ncbi:metallophosphoesterase [Azospirillum sp. B4]|uniref:metallophosphoesterase family protein n=1 Tax=Azospirillum sp. B4 TaxID=95605 RepID=UPI000349FE82|nr:metallophosphoesterase [Azospirillum sp. B4]
MTRPDRSPQLFAISDLHLDHRENRALAEMFRPDGPDDWLAVVGDVSHRLEAIVAFLGLMRERFAKVIFTPGNHDLWQVAETERGGEDRYRHLVERCRAIDVATPEDPYPLWPDHGGAIAVAPLFILYDYSLRPDGISKQQALAASRVRCSDEALLKAHPFPDVESWCAARLDYTAARLAALPDGTRTVLMSHWPLHPGPLGRLWYPEFSLWCGTRRTADWHRRFRAVCSVYGHLHIPLTDQYDGVRHVEASLGYPRERAAHPRLFDHGPRRILPL